MLNGLEISNLVVKRFGRVNLIVGKNGAGKTALLSAIQEHARAGCAAPPSLPPAGVDVAELAQWWDVLEVHAKGRALDALRSAVGVSALAFTADARASQTHPIAMARLAGLDDAIPLPSCGHGVERTVEIVVALEYAAAGGGGTILIDGIEAGMHFTLQASVWRLIVRAAQSLHVQVFATTHSWDCLSAFAGAVAASRADALLIRLEKMERAGRIRAIIMDRSNLAIIVRHFIEVR